MHRRAACGTVAALTLALSACASTPGSDAATVEAYCAYGAVSEAQFDGCVDHVTIEDVESRDTAAARFALAGGGDCPADASEFCEYWQEGELAEEDIASDECEPSSYYGGRGGGC